MYKSKDNRTNVFTYSSLPLSTLLITPAGQVFTQSPHPTHKALSTIALTPFFTFMASLSHTFIQAPQATQLFETTA